MIPECLITSNVNLNHLIQWRSLTDHLKVILFLLCLLTSIHQWFLLVLVFTSVCIMIFLISSFLLHLLIGIWCKEEPSLSSAFCWFSYLYHYGVMDTHFIVWIIIHCCDYFSFCSVDSDLATGNSFRLVPLSFWHGLVMFWALH